MSDPVEMMVLQQAQSLPDVRRGEFQLSYMSQRKARATAMVLSLLLGAWGADRFYLGQTGLGVAKLLTAGGCGVWMLIDWFLILGATDQYNQSVLQKLAMVYPPAPQMQGHGYGPPRGSGYGPPPGPYGMPR